MSDRGASDGAVHVANAPVSYGAFELTVGIDPDVPSADEVYIALPRHRPLFRGWRGPSVLAHYPLWTVSYATANKRSKAVGHLAERSR